MWQWHIKSFINVTYCTMEDMYFILKDVFKAVVIKNSLCVFFYKLKANSGCFQTELFLCLVHQMRDSKWHFPHDII